MRLAILLLLAATTFGMAQTADTPPPQQRNKPGFYTCQVNVIDDAAGRFAFPRLALLVRSDPTPAVGQQ